MKIKILLFARIKELAREPSLEVMVSSGATVGELRSSMEREYPWLEPWLRCSNFAVNGAFARLEDFVREGDEVALIPPVSGGCEKLRVMLTNGDIDPDHLLEKLDDGVDGAVVVFLGNVRSRTGNQSTESLFYEAYEPLAENELIRIGEEALGRFSLGKARIVHRLGQVVPGKSAVGIAVSAPHRSEAFQACSWIMDRIKQTAPIWKRDHSPDGRVDWVHPGAPETDAGQ